MPEGDSLTGSTMRTRVHARDSCCARSGTTGRVDNCPTLSPPVTEIAHLAAATLRQVFAPWRSGPGCHQVAQLTHSWKHAGVRRSDVCPRGKAVTIADLTPVLAYHSAWSLGSKVVSQDQRMPDPIALGRSVVVGPGDTTPGEWSSCERVRVTTVDRATADELGAAWRERRSVTIELTPGLGLDDPEVPPAEAVTGRQPWEWPVDLDLVGERLHHAVWANSIDARASTQRRRWHWADVACNLGANLTDTGADIVLPDGTPALCDGGPLDAALGVRVGMALIHRISLEHGVLQPLGPNDPVGVPLAADQLEAVAEPGAGSRIIAPAGSGKTRVLTERARLLLGGWGLPPAALALVAYNTRAANEMKERLADVADVRVRTLNALGLRLCGRRATIEEVEVRRLLGGLITFPKRAETDPVAPWIEALGRVRLGLADPATVEDELPDVSDLDRVARAYRAQLAEQEVVDFDEQVTGAIERLLGDPAFRRRTQRFARVLLVDEFQDLTPAHLLLIRLLTGPAGAVFGVGDDDQTIYGYAGATPRWLVDFGHWFPGAAMHSLEVNYRCPAPVVTAASNLLTRNALRVEKVIRVAPATVTQPSGPEHLSILSGDDGPATRAANRVRDLLDRGATPADVAVLARVNASLAPVQVLLRNSGVPVDGGVSQRFLQRGGVRAALAWLAVATAPDGALPGPVLREVARRPKRGMSASLLDLVGKKGSVDGLVGLAGWLEGKGSAREADKVRGLADDVARASARRPSAARRPTSWPCCDLTSATVDWTRVPRRSINGATVPAPPTVTISTHWPNWPTSRAIRAAFRRGSQNS